MSRRTLSGAVLASLLIAGCGGSAHSTSSTSTATTTTATATVSAGPTTTTATTSSRPPEVPKQRAPKHSKPTAPNTNVRIPAAFIIRAGAITPPLIAVPANVTIELQLRNHDPHTHRVQFSVAHVAAVTVPAHGSKTTDVSGAPKGTYRLLVDGAAKAHIIVGVVPGP